MNHWLQLFGAHIRVGLLLIAAFACSPIPTPQGSSSFRSSSAETSPSSAVAAEHEGDQEKEMTDRQGDTESALVLARGVAQRTAELYDRSKAASEDIYLRLRIRVVGKPASLLAEREHIQVLTGAEGARAADMTVELSKQQARAIVDGDASLRSLVQSGETQTDNEQGLARFLEFIIR